MCVCFLLYGIKLFETKFIEYICLDKDEITI